MSKISGQLLISGQFQDTCDISGISGQLGALRSFAGNLEQAANQLYAPANSASYPPWDGK